ncbi:MAG: hypothetical protein AAB225_21275 [Acidobacteriota bacterium]
MRACGAGAFLPRLVPWRKEPACFPYLAVLAILFFIASCRMAGSLSGGDLFFASVASSAALLVLSALVAWAYLKSRVRLASVVLGTAAPLAFAIIIVSSLDPVRYLSTGGPGTSGDAPSTEELARWHAALNYFARRRLGGSRGSSQADYASAWDSCSKSEKLHLIHLARHGLMNPKAADITRALLASGLLRRDSGGRIEFSDPGFRAFVRTAEPPERVREWEAEDRGRLRVPWVPLLFLTGGQTSSV